MKQIVLTFIILFTLGIGISHAQEPTDKLATRTDETVVEGLKEGWNKNGTGAVTFNQVGLKNWAAGGDPSISFLFLLRYNATLKKGKHLWENRLMGEFGLQKIRGEKFRKNSDIIELFSKYGYQVAEKWYFASLINVRSQFSPTYDFDDDGNRTDMISRFAAPAIMELSVGMEYVPNQYFSLYLSPIASKMIFVMDDDIANIAGGTEGFNIHGTELGENYIGQFGALIIARYQQNVWNNKEGLNNVSIGSTLKLYRDYLRGPAQNIDVDWQTNIGFKINKYLAASVFTHLIYDYDVAVINESGEAKRLQFKNVIGVGFSYNF